ncbi:RICIN domain-containing protein [Streptomyces sp. NBC_01373]|uniref:RICIN domain-containing protein n=1 Tax=Streptomyces sp. NBC_01373 TaxID=2903843 RepID=UPI002256BF85|nr:ricin-type beta-trefoil lectin domain protein [Streptomyces sp. NBC_01373]MCX4702485.1 ricin-type beta-trefoil lectin domain protein [Streptomyces sp. NBC_01373]
MARLEAAGTDAHAVALLMARHWRAAYDYAGICLVSSAGSASMAAAAAFHRMLGRAGGGAVRPQLLRAVRETVKDWAADDGISAVLPEVRKPTGGRGLRAARSATPERRQLAERAFQALPGASQCLLWHTEVEAEPISVPAGLLGVDPARAKAGLEQAREQFRAGCVRAHRELAPTTECRFYNRLLDVPIRRGGGLLPDVQQHLAGCRYCRHAAEQLSHFEGGLEELLAETVLGWGAHRYLDSRPGRGHAQAAPGARLAVRPRPGGRHRPAPAGAFAAPRRHTKAVLVGAGLASLALLASVLVAKGWSDEGGVPGPRATWGAPSGHSVSPGAVGEAPSAASVGSRTEVAHGRLRNLAADLCLDVRGGGSEDGAGTLLTACSAAASQQWSYQGDGLLRSAVDATRCLDADADEGSVVLADCVVHAGEVRYDLTVRGELLLRRGGGLLVAPGPGNTVVVADRDGSAEQRWVLEPASGATGGAEPRGGTRDGGPGTPDAPPATSPSPDADPPRKDPEAPQGDPVVPPPQFEKRMAQVGADTTDTTGGAPEPVAPVEEVQTLPGAVLDTAGPVAETVTANLGTVLG